jgi:hypothetical protein
MAPVGKRLTLDLPPGVNKNDNSYTSLSWSDANRVRFFKRYPQKIGGWDLIFPYLDFPFPMRGAIRTIYNFINNSGIDNLILGTSYGLYSYTIGTLYNITPLQTSSITLSNNPITTYFETLVNNPLSVVNGSTEITMDITAFPSSNIFMEGDLIKISGSSDLGNIPAANINAVQTIDNITATTVTFTVSTAANANYTGGGAAVTVGTQVITISDPATTEMLGDRIKLSGITSFNGLLNTDMNVEGLARNIQTNSFDVYLTNSANDSTAAGTGGGAVVLLFRQILAGPETFSPAEGYGGGLYGSGDYGISKEFTNGFTAPQIWSMDRFGQNLALTPGNQGLIYTWTGDVNVAPIVVSAAPNKVNWIFTSNNVLVALGVPVSGPDIVPNAFANSDTADLGNWTVGPATNADLVEIPGANALISRAYVNGQNILFTNNAVYSLNYVAKPFIWVTDLITLADGIIGPRAYVSANDLVYWVGFNDIYVYNGNVYQNLPNNTLKQWFVQNMNPAKSYLTFMRTCLEFNEVWIFFPFGDSPEPNAYIIYNFEEGTFTNGFLSRTASEEPSNQNRPQYMAVSMPPLVLNFNPIAVTLNTSAFNVTIDEDIIINFSVNMYVELIGITGPIAGVAASVFNNIYQITGIFINAEENYITLQLPNGILPNATVTGGGGAGMIRITPNLYQHEVNYGDGNIDTPMQASVTTNYSLVGDGDLMQEIDRVIPSTDVLFDAGEYDPNMALYNIIINTKEYDGSTEVRTFPPVPANALVSPGFPVAITTEKIDVRANGRQRQYTFTSNTVEPFRLQKWFEEIRATTTR